MKLPKLQTVINVAAGVLLAMVTVVAVNDLVFMHPWSIPITVFTQGEIDNIKTQIMALIVRCGRPA